MTIKGRRAENLPKLTDAEIKSLAPKGGAVDNAIPATAAAVLTRFAEIDAAAFGAFFGPRMALYRERSADAAQRLSVADELQIAAVTCEMIAELRLRFELLPDTVRVRADEALWATQRVMWFDVQQRLDAQLREAWKVLSSASKNTEAYAGRSGAKSASARDGLALDTAAEIERLLPKRQGAKKRAAEIALSLLQVCAVPVPADLAEFQKLLRKAGKN